MFIQWAVVLKELCLRIERVESSCKNIREYYEKTCLPVSTFHIMCLNFSLKSLKK